ncbi:MAG: hypothetical protein HYW22_00595 [Candidatus Aenigmarchaeota archaeon]|nr:hypothetical protein [Candidatus Aenigmarchaeota archaeon]
MIKGKATYLNHLYSRFNFKTIEVGESVSGASPPSVFIGKEGYPKVFVGPLIPPVHGDTMMMDLPEEWFKTNKTVEDVINFRLSLVRGKETLDIKDVQSKTALKLQEIALAKNSLELEAEFTKKPRGVFFNEDIQPFGPSAELKEMRVTSGKMERHMEKFYYDTDLKSKEAVVNLYNNGLVVSAIQKALSVGAFGLEKNRKLVPTKWSITAVDDMLSLHLLEKIKSYPMIEGYRVYESENINNKFVIMLLPMRWFYESMEVWFPNIIGDKLEVGSDYERFDGKKGYASIGGAYYSARLAVNELLENEKRQAAVIIFREAYPGYIPLGVWNVRENVREAMKKQPKKFDSINTVLEYVGTRVKTPMKEWIKQSNLLRETIQQRKLSQFIRT